MHKEQKPNGLISVDGLEISLDLDDLTEKLSWGVGAAQRKITMRGALAIFLPNPTQRTTTESVMAHDHKISNKAAIEKESNSEQKDSQIGLNNIGYLCSINMLPFHVETMARGATLLLALFGMFLIWRVTKCDTIKKMYHCCFPSRHQTVLKARKEAEGTELR